MKCLFVLLEECSIMIYEEDKRLVPTKIVASVELTYNGKTLSPFDSKVREARKSVESQLAELSGKYAIKVDVSGAAIEM